jgi:hypothetical protein
VNRRASHERRTKPARPHSIGRRDGATLVVETVGFAPDCEGARFGIPKRRAQASKSLPTATPPSLCGCPCRLRPAIATITRRSARLQLLAMLRPPSIAQSIRRLSMRLTVQGLRVAAKSEGGLAVERFEGALGDARSLSLTETTSLPRAVNSFFAFCSRPISESSTA